MTTMYAEPIASTRRRPPAHLSRTRLLGWSIVFMLSWPVATVLFCVWVSVAAVSPLTLFVPVLLGLTVVVRGYLDLHRRWAGRMLGELLPRPYRSTADGGWLARARVTLTDPASWRDALWLFVHSTLGAILSIVSFALFAGSVLYLSYPFLYWVTPDNVFGQPFGFFTLHDVGQSFAMMPLGLVCFGIWFGSVRPMAMAHAKLMRSLLR